jgi:hypothetical protein
LNEEDAALHATVEARGILELQSILSALHLHFERIQLGISPKSGRMHVNDKDNSCAHPFFYGLKTSNIEAFLCQYLFGTDTVKQLCEVVSSASFSLADPKLDPIREDCKEIGSQDHPSTPTTLSLPPTEIENNLLQNKKLDVLARQLHLTPEIIRRETLLFCQNLENPEIKPYKGGTAPRRSSQTATPKASHSKDFK